MKIVSVHLRRLVNIPWSVKNLKGKYCVVKKGEFIPIKDGCFDSEDEAAEKVKALYGSEADLAIAEAHAELENDSIIRGLNEVLGIVTKKKESERLIDQKPVYKSYDEYMAELTASGKEIVEHAWEGPIAFEGVFTGDKRFFRPGSIEWNADSFPVPFRWQKSSIQGHQGAVPVGRVDHLERKDDGTIYGYGVIIPSLNEEAAEYLRLLEAGVGSGVSVDGDSAVFDVKELADGTTSVEFSSMRIRSLTAVDIPAFDQAQVDLVHEGEEAELPETKTPMKWEYNLTASGCAPVKPPIEWFEDPKLDEPTPIKINAQGEIFGHLALFDSCHIGFPGSCVSPPKNGTYKYFHTGELETDKGDLVEVGHLTFNTGHAAMADTAKSAAAHYDHTGTVAADVRVGEDKYGIWVAGALRSHLDDEDVRAFRAAPLSGDWRRIAGKLELVGALAVNVPGFPVPRVRTLVASGETETLITFQEAEALASQDRRDELGQRVLAFQIQASRDKKRALAQRLGISDTNSVDTDATTEEFFNPFHAKDGRFGSGKGSGGGGGAKAPLAAKGEDGKRVKLGTVSKVNLGKLSDKDLLTYRKKAKNSSIRWAAVAGAAVVLGINSRARGGSGGPTSPISVFTGAMAIGRISQRKNAEAELTKRGVSFSSDSETLVLDGFDFETFDLDRLDLEFAITEEQIRDLVGDPDKLTDADGKKGLTAVAEILGDEDEDLTPDQTAKLKDLQAQLKKFFGGDSLGKADLVTQIGDEVDDRVLTFDLLTRREALAYRVFTFAEDDDLKAPTKEEIQTKAKNLSKADLAGYLKGLKDLLADADEGIDDAARKDLEQVYKLVSEHLVSEAAGDTEEFFNKSHGKDGRFSSGKGSGGGALKAAKPDSKEPLSKVVSLGNSRDPLNKQAKTPREANQKFNRAAHSAGNWAGVAILATSAAMAMTGGSIAAPFLIGAAAGATLNVGLRVVQAKRHRDQRDALLREGGTPLRKGLGSNE